MPAATLSRDEVVKRILAVFRTYGYEGASLARLSEATGLGRSSLYHYFPNGKTDMAMAALAAVAEWSGEHLMPLLEGSAPPSQRVRRFAEAWTGYYRDGSAPCLMDLFTIGDAGPLFRQKLEERMRMLIGALAKAAEDAGISPEDAARRAEDAVIAVQGSLVVSRALGSNAPFLRVIDDLPGRLTGKS